MAIVAPHSEPATVRGSPVRRLARSFVAGPAAIPALVVVAVMAVWAATEAGQPPTHWYPGALVILGLLILAASTLPLRLRDVPRPVLVAAGCLLAFTLWSFLSIAWADANGEAWDGANRTLLYLVVFLLFALWTQRAGAATTVVSLWILAVAVVAGGVLVDTRAADALDLFSVGRLSEPAGYANATAALFLMPAWPALVLAGRRELGPPLRGLLGGAATLLAGVALISLSRGAVFSVPIMLILLFAVVPGRARTFAVLVPIALGVAVSVPAVLQANDQLPKQGAAEALTSLAPTIGLAALGAAVVIAVGSFVEGRVLRPELRRVAQRVIAGVGIATLIAVLVAALVIAGNPIERVQDGWDSFKQGYSSEPGQRLSQGLGSNRYDFYRVSLDLFASHPLTGIGADNFQQDYLAARKSGESPRYPHSVALRTLAQTGLVGALLLVGFVVAALTAALRPIRRATPLGAVTAAAAATAFVYWLIHGSFDWFWEFAGLGVPAFAMLGLACGLSPRTAEELPDHDDDRPLLPRLLVIAALVLAVLSMALPWLADVGTQYAAEKWRLDPNAAYERLDRAAFLDRLSPDPYLVAGTIALRRSEQARAQTSFRRALSRDPRSAYATLELGALASSYERREEAKRLLARAVRLDPRDPLKRDALAQVRTSGRVDIEALNRAILERAERIR